MLTDVELSDLSTELATDPESLGYTGDDASDADLLNEVGASGETIQRPAIPMGEFYGEIDWVNEVGPLSTGLTIKFMVLTSTPNLAGDSATIRDALVAIFGADSNTVAAFDAVRDRSASRAEVLFGPGTSVSPSEVAEARRL